jgi:hypothetical protein
MPEVNPALFLLFQIAASMFVLMVIARILNAEFDKTSILILAGISVILGYYLFGLVEVLTALLLLGIIIRMWKRSKEPKAVPFVPPDYGEGGLNERE